MNIHPLIQQRVRARVTHRLDLGGAPTAITVANEMLATMQWLTGNASRKDVRVSFVVRHYVEHTMRQHPFARIHNPLRQRVKFETGYSGYKLIRARYKLLRGPR